MLLENNLSERHARALLRIDDDAVRKQLLDKVYNGAAGELIAAFLKESHMTQAERDRLRKLLDEMEV